MRRDYLTDGQVGELDFAWAPGAAIHTDFGGAAASTGVTSLRSDRNPGGVPTVFAYPGASSFVDFQADDVFGPDGTPEVLKNVMAYAQVYVLAEQDLEVFLGIASDDAVQVFLNREDVWIHSIGRGGANSCSEEFPQDETPRRVLLSCGENRLLVKVFERDGEWNFGRGSTPGYTRL
ncbi:MAG: hypothetical protein HY721_17050 [Planctomycetes bacterium]|nr:hypothetical protein [Planctomycetota bacterium]